MNSTQSCNLYVDLSEVQSQSRDNLQAHVETLRDTAADGLILDLYRTERLVSSVHALDRARSLREHQLDREDFLDLHRAYHTDSFKILARVYDPELVRWYTEETSADRLLTHGGDITFKRLLEAANETELEVLLTVKASQLDTIQRAQSWLADTETTLVHEEYENEPATLDRYEVLRNQFGEEIGVADPSGDLDRKGPLPSSPACWILRFSANSDQTGWDIQEVDRFKKRLNRHEASPEGTSAADDTLSFTERDRKYRRSRRRSLMADRSLSAGSVLSRDMIRELRPAEGLPAEEIDNVVGMLVPRPTDPQEMISY